MAGRIPPRFIDELLSRVDIVDVIGARVPLKQRGREHMACCPFHNEKTPSFTVSGPKQFFHCFGCGAHGSAIRFLMDYENLEFVDAVEELAQMAGLEVPREAQSSFTTPADHSLYGVLEKAAEYYRLQLRQHPQAARAVDYLKHRGLSGEIAAEYGIGYAPPGWDNVFAYLGSKGLPVNQLQAAGLLIAKDGGGHYDRFRDRVMFPIRDRRGRVIAFGGRVLGDDTPKYLNSPETEVFHKGRELYGLHEARKAIRHLERLIVVEGYMDVVSLAQFGIRNVVATLGTATTSEHLQRLFRLVPEVVFCFDGDRAGRAAAWRALETALPVMQDGRQISFVFLPDGEDPDTLVRKQGTEAFTDLLSRGMPLSEFLFQGLGQRVDLTSLDGRSRLVELARPLLNRLTDGVFRQLLVSKLAEDVGLKADKLDRLLRSGEPAPKPVQHAESLRPEGRSTLIRHAVHLLLHRPGLAVSAGDTSRLAGLQLRGVGLLIEVIETLKENPHITLGAMLERWRDTETGQHLDKLSQKPLPVADGDFETEFSDVLSRLHRLRSEHRAEQLLAQSRERELSPDEKAELREILPVR